MLHENIVLTEIVGHQISLDPRGRVLDMKKRRTSANVCTMRGRIRFQTEDAVFFSDPAHPILLPEGGSYRNECLEEAQSYLFTFHAAQPLTLENLPLPSAHFFSDIYNALEDACTGDEMLARLRNFEIFYRMLYGIAAVRRENADSPVEAAVREMNLRFADPALTVRDVARGLYLSESCLRRHFLDRLGVTPYRYLIGLRMRKAALLLAEGLPVSAVARTVGYSDVYQFSRGYKRYSGRVPSSEKDTDAARSQPGASSAEAKKE